MKLRTTAKQLRNGYYHKYRVGYCDLQNLFRGLDAFAYTCGVYGWNFDAYEIDGVLITTGYRGMIGERIPSELIRKYESLANEIGTRPFTDPNKYEDLEKLRHQFVKELMEVTK